MVPLVTEHQHGAQIQRHHLEQGMATVPVTLVMMLLQQDRGHHTELGHHHELRPGVV